MLRNPKYRLFQLLIIMNITIIPNYFFEFQILIAADSTGSDFEHVDQIKTIQDGVLFQIG
jgi:hypothetical protein